MGLSRDDAGKFLPAYVESGILPRDPFVSLDKEGVGYLVKTAIERGRKTREKLKLGICGEHGGDPASVQFFFEAGLDYVSCSPFRVAVARLRRRRPRSRRRADEAGEHELGEREGRASPSRGRAAPRRGRTPSTGGRTSCEQGRAVST